MIPTFVDLETAYSTEYSLSRLTNAEYILNPAFQLICCAIKEDPREQSRTYWGEDAETYLLSLDWSDRMLICHHTRFDGTVLAWRYGIRPRMYGCTMAMADAILTPFTGSASLAACCEILGLPPKGHEVIAAKGKWRHDFTADEALAYMAYCARDNDSCAEIFVKLVNSLPRDELEIIDDLIRMYVEPRFQYDIDCLYQYQNELELQKEQLLQEAGLLDRDALMSDTKLADVLRGLGVDPPMKISFKTGQPIFAFAKTDDEFTELLESDDPAVSALVAARLGHKSTIEQTRTERFIAAAHLTAEHWAPVPLRYAAALTHRFGGTDKINKQNLRRSHPTDPKRPPPLRKSLKAPPGYVVVAADASQIELRCLFWQAGQWDALEVLAQGKNIYIDFGVELFGKVIDKEAELEPYTLCKISVLSSGYGVGAPKFRRTARAQSGGRVQLSDIDAQRTVNTYRRKYWCVPKLWEQHGEWLKTLGVLASREIVIDNNVCFQLLPNAIRGPTGLVMHYPGLRFSETSREWIYTYRKNRVRKIYGAKITENCTQHLARCVVCDVQTRVRRRTGLRPALQSHDELAYVVPEAAAPYLAPILKAEFQRRMPWAPNLPLNGSVKIGPNYGEMREWRG